MPSESDRRRYGITQAEMVRRHRQRLRELALDPDDPHEGKVLLSPAELIALRYR